MDESEQQLARVAQKQRLFLAMKQMQTKLDTVEQQQREPIAVVGMSCRFPGPADSPEAFWSLLRAGRDAIGEMPAQRWNVDAFFDAELAFPGTMNTRWGGFLEQVDQFDPGFFGLSSREAASIDPQQRLLLEVAWETLERAGLSRGSLAGSRTGVFIGISTWDFAALSRSAPPRGGTGLALSMAANRLSYFFDFHGPSMAIETACSSSLVAADLACRSLRMGEVDLALVGGVNVMLSPLTTVAFSQVGMMAPDGRCKTFDAAADGYVRSEGCGMVALKRLSTALADRHEIAGLIRGSAVNHDGRSNGLTAPNGLAQQAVMRQALEHAGVEPAQIGYLEAHGTGTSLGDIVEMESIARVIGPGRPVDQSCWVGSVKTNIGHLEAAAGIAGLIKTLLVLQEEEIPPHLHLKKLNPELHLESLPLQIPTARRVWKRGEKPRFAGVSSFGFGGANAHLVLQEAPLPEPLVSSGERPRHLFALAARDPSALRELAGRYRCWLAKPGEWRVADICYTATAGRTHFEHRLAVPVASVEELQTQLTMLIDGMDQASAKSPAVRGDRWIRGTAPRNRPAPKVIFLFTGQGSHYAGMTRQLYATQPVFRRVVEQCSEILGARLEPSLLEVLYAEGRESLLNQTAYAQPALFAVGAALAEVWRWWGVTPQAVMGHSVGEYTAAYVAGAFGLEEGLGLVAERARLMQAAPGDGAMALVAADAGWVGQRIAAQRSSVVIAAFNGPRHTVISGAREAVEAFLDQLEQDNVLSHPLRVSHAFHSPLMGSASDALAHHAGQFRFAPLQLPMASNLTGEVLQPGTLLDVEYWRRQLLEPVRFAQGMAALAAAGGDFFLELGPADTLANMGRKCLPAEAPGWLSSLRRGREDWETLLASLGRLYVAGAPVDWEGFERGYARRRVSLPTYPFQRKRCWPELEELHSFAGPREAAQQGTQA